MRTSFRIVIGAVLVLGLPFVQVSAAASSPPSEDHSLRLPELFTSGMVLQRNMPCPVWGWAEPGTSVTLSLKGAETTGTATASAVADARGTWRAELGPFAAGGPCTLTVSGADGTGISLEDVLIGEVWVCSGQSNMDWEVRDSRDAKEEIAAANYPQIRLFAVPHRTSAAPQEDLDGSKGWVPCTPDNVKRFSAVAYFFGRDLHQHLDVPVGLIKTAYGGTPAEAWTSREALAPFPEFRLRLEELASYPPDREKAGKLYRHLMNEWYDEIRRKDPWDAVLRANGSLEVALPASADASSRTMSLPGKWEEAGLENFDGTVWFRKVVDLPEQWKGRQALLRLGHADDEDEAWFNGREVGSTRGVRPSRSYKVEGDLLRAGKNVITVRVLDLGGGGGFNATPEEFALETTGTGPLLRYPLAGEWEMYRGADLSTVSMRPEPATSAFRPAVLFNGMVAPLIPYAIRGVIWYQGESNAHRADQYVELFPTMIRDWRNRWDQGDFPFLYVQLANYLARKPEPGDDNWAELREAQLLALKLPNTAMASAIDLGEADDIHPRNKQDVGRRLARAARAVAYGEPVEWSGPIYTSMEKENGAIRLHFSHDESGLVARGGALRGFAVAGSDGKFVWADARIEGETVVVSSPAVPDPQAVRYSWATNPDGNLYNGEGLPAPPFRTDNRPRVTKGVK